MIYISTGLIKKQSALKTCKYFLDHDINDIELSGGTFEENIIKKIKTLKGTAKFTLHNYFPPPKNPFTLNLATLDQNLFKICYNHIKNTIRYSNEIGSKVYSFHAGFLIDPKPNELGKKFTKRKINNRNHALNIFIDRLNNLSIFAKKEGVSLLIENNVINKKNLNLFKTNPLLMADTKEACFIMRNTPNNVNLLVDVAHLKVSAKSLKFDPNFFFSKCEQWIQGYHLSDNDGNTDSNGLVSKNSWFWKHLKKNLNYYTLEIKSLNAQILLKQKKITEQMLR